MAEGLNKAILIGNLGTEPELRFTTGGRAVLKLRMATNETWKDKDGQKQERTDWHTVIMWGKRAEALNGILSKGGRIGVDGRIRSRKFEGKDGIKRTAIEVEAQNIVLLDNRRGFSGSSSSAPPDPDHDPYAPAPDTGAQDDIPF